MGDPLYAVLSRNCWPLKTGAVPTNDAEIDRLCETAREVARDTEYTQGQRNVGKRFAKRAICRR
jgi:hypothetical protein